MTSAATLFAPSTPHNNAADKGQHRNLFLALFAPSHKSVHSVQASYQEGVPKYHPGPPGVIPKVIAKCHPHPPFGILLPNVHIYIE